MTTVVTGASGHIGANLVRALVARNRAVRAVVHKNSQDIKGLGIETVNADICDPDSLRHAFSGADVVYHLAARVSITGSDWPLLELVNVTGTRNVVEACIRCHVRRLVHFSSIDALAKGPLDAPVDEQQPLVESRRCLPYDLSKAAGEKEVLKGLENGLDAIILYPTAIVGPHDYEPSLFGEVLLSLAHHKLPALVAGGFDWVDVRDVVNTAIGAEEQAATGARYILSGHWLSIREVAAMVSELTGVSPPRFVCPLWLASIAAPALTTLARLRQRRPFYTSTSIAVLRNNRSISCQKACLELEYQPRPFRETIIDTLKWFEANGSLKQPLILKSRGLP